LGGGKGGRLTFVRGARTPLARAGSRREVGGARVPGCWLVRRTNLRADGESTSVEDLGAGDDQAMGLRAAGRGRIPARQNQGHGGESRRGGAGGRGSGGHSPPVRSLAAGGARCHADHGCVRQTVGEFETSSSSAKEADRLIWEFRPAVRCVLPVCKQCDTARSSSGPTALFILSLKSIIF